MGEREEVIKNSNRGIGDWFLVNKQRLQLVSRKNFVFCKTHSGHFIIWKATEIDTALLQSGSQLKDYERSADFKTTNPRLPWGTDTSERKWFSQSNR